MTVPDPQGPDREDRIEDEVLDRLYEVAVDPARYGDLLEIWEKMIGPHRRRASPGAPVELPSHDFETHFARVVTLLDRTAANAPRSPEAAELNVFRRSAAFSLNRNIRVSAVNEAAAERFGLAAGDMISALPLALEDHRIFADSIRALFASPDRRTAVLRLRADDSAEVAGRVILFQLRHVQPAEGEPFVIAVSSELRWPASLTRTLRQTFGLTDSEVEVLRGLTESRSPREIAAQRNRSIQTVRAQIKSLLQKTETHSQGDLLRLTLSAMDFGGTGTADGEEGLAEDGAPFRISASPALETRSFRRLDVGGGRHLDYLVFGAETAGARDVIYLSGLYGLCRWPAEAEASAARMGLRVMVPIKPGYGGSSPLPRGADRSATAQSDLDALVRHLNIRSCAILTLDEDFRHAIRFADRHPDCVTGILAASAALPPLEAREFEEMGKWHRFILGGARYTPGLFSYMVKAGFAMARRLGKRGYLETVYASSPGDARMSGVGGVMEALETGSETVLSDRGSAAPAFADEYVAAINDAWEVPGRRVSERIPVHVVVGREDPRMPPILQKRLRALLPDAIHRLCPGSGQFVFFQIWPELLPLIGELAKSAPDRSR